jgi:N-hydroxyarylamine O-acetyltransferase
MRLDIDTYLQRISYEGDIHIDHNTLAALQYHHLVSVPFENLDIHLGNKIKLDLAHLEKKIVRDKRGGFCYELNGLFYALLHQLGFQVKMVAARVAKEEGRFGQEFDHMALIVDLGGEWLVDVGFGDSFLLPMPLEVGIKHQDPSGYYIIETYGKDSFRLEASENDRDYTPQYFFTRTERQLEDYTQGCIYHQTSPESSFTRSRVCSLATETGRITLTDKEFIETVVGRKNVRAVKDEKEFYQILRDKFEINVR